MPLIYLAIEVEKTVDSDLSKHRDTIKLMDALRRDVEYEGWRMVRVQRGTRTRATSTNHEKRQRPTRQT